MELLIQIIVGSTITALLVLFARFIITGRVKSKWHLWLWLILAIRLMFPIMPESDFSFMNHLPESFLYHYSVDRDLMKTRVDGFGNLEASLNSVENIGDSQSENLDGTRQFENSNDNQMISNDGLNSQMQSYERQQQIKNVILVYVILIWAIGALCFAIYFITSAIGIKRKLLCFLDWTDTRVIGIFHECATKASVRSDRITLKKGSTRPFVFGSIHPIVVIPEEENLEVLEHMILHECYHIKHQDGLLRFVGCALLTIYWFHPLMWYCFHAFSTDLELICDEQVVAQTGERQSYASTLLKTTSIGEPLTFGSLGFFRGKKEVAKRIKNLSFEKRTGVGFVALMVILVLGIGFITLTNGREAVVRVGIGDYFFEVPASYTAKMNEQDEFCLENNQVFGGVHYQSAEGIDLEQTESSYGESLLTKGELFLPNHSEVLEAFQKEKGDLTFLIYHIRAEKESAAQFIERTDKEQDDAVLSSNEIHIFVLTHTELKWVYEIWAEENVVSEKQIIQVAESFQKIDQPDRYQPEKNASEDQKQDAKSLLTAYFKGYEDANLPMDSDISGVQIEELSAVGSNREIWSFIYPSVFIYRLNYTLEPAYPDWYNDLKSGAIVKKDNQQIEYRNQLAVFDKDVFGKIRLIGIVPDSGIEGQNQNSESMYHQDFTANTIINTLENRVESQSALFLYDLRTPYIGDASADGRIIGALPLHEYGNGVELHTKAEPYGITVSYDMTKAGNGVFVSRPDKALADSSGWEISPMIKRQLKINGMIFMALVDNCDSVEFQVLGIADGVSYKHSICIDRQSIEKDWGASIRETMKQQDTFQQYLAYLRKM